MITPKPCILLIFDGKNPTIDNLHRALYYESHLEAIDIGQLYTRGKYNYLITVCEYIPEGAPTPNLPDILTQKPLF